MTEANKTTILNVDDNLVARTKSTMILTHAGFDVIEAGTGREALEQVKQLPDLILLDVQLPDIDGFEVCRLVRQDPATSHIPVLHLSASVKSDADKVRGLDGGAEGYLVQPITPEVLVAYVGALLRTRQAEARLDEAYNELKRTHDDHLSILNRLRIGIATIDGQGEVTFINDTAELLLGRRRDKVLGQRWEAALPLAQGDQDRLERLMDSPSSDCETFQTLVTTEDGSRHCLELEVEDDPRLPEQRMLLMYDRSEVHDLRQMLDGKASFQDMVGRSAPMEIVFQRIQAVATVDWTTLIEGETGTGKELVARAIHSLSDRVGEPFIAVNCAALAAALLSSQLFGHKRGAFTGAVKDQEGLFEAARGGTLFLDEIGDISQNMQRSLLRVLEEKELTRLGETNVRKVDVRVLCATHRDLVEAVRAGTFRQDLLYRIRIARISLPPLHRRREDIPLLVAAFLKKSRAATGKQATTVSTAAMNVLLRHSWPGNVRELKTAIDFATLHCMGTVIRSMDLPPEIATTEPVAEIPREDLLSDLPPPAPQQDERQQILHALAQANGKRTQAARILGISRATFYRRITHFNIDLD